MGAANDVPLLVKEWRRLLAKATAGPWKSRPNSQKPYKHVQFDKDEMYTTSPIEAADSDLIVSLRNHAEEILAALESHQGGSAPTESPAATAGHAGASLNRAWAKLLVAEAQATEMIEMYRESSNKFGLGHMVAVKDTLKVAREALSAALASDSASRVAKGGGRR
jgi:hypothetical protein